MRIDAVELRCIRIPLVSPFRTSFGTETVREALVLRVESVAGEGWGECVASPEPFYSSEHNEGVASALRGFLAPLLLDAGDVTAAAVEPLLRRVKGNRMAKGALEMAVLDAELRAAGMSFATFLGGVRDTVEPGVSVGIKDSLGELLDTVERHLDEGYGRIKLKIEPGWDVEPVRAVRDRIGSSFRLQVDANTAYARSDIEHLAKLDDFDLLLIEQPLDEEDVIGHARLARRLRTPVCLDESIVSARSAADAIALGACSIVNIKAGRVGGYLEARRVHDVCRANGVPVWCGGMLETGLGRAANLALASLPGFTLPGDVSATDRYFDEDITARFVLDGGKIAVPTGPGLGVEVDRSRLDACTVRREVLTRAEA